MERSMANNTLRFGTVLVALGVAGYLLSGLASVTALIPAFFGILFLGLGLAARRERMRKPALWIALVLAFLGLFGSAAGIPEAFRLVAGGTVERPIAAVVQTGMALACTGYVALFIRDYFAARARGGAKA
jgi:hypothetical protein